MYPDALKRSSLAAEAFVVDVTPEIAVVLSIGDRDSLAGGVVMAHAAGELQLLGVNVEPIDVVEDAFGVIDDPAGGGTVPVPRRQRSHAPPQTAD
jgi:hypothetical protein